jgi:hypothetical protein
MWLAPGNDVRRSLAAVRSTAGICVGLAVLSSPAVVLGQGAGITRVTASRVSSSSATIAWSTAIRSDSQVLYGPAATYGNFSPRDSSMVEFHSQTLTALQPGTMYHFRAQSVAEDGTISFSGDFIFLTLPAQPDLNPAPTPVPEPSPAAAVAAAPPARSEVPAVVAAKPVESASTSAPSKAGSSNEQNRKTSCDMPDPYSALGGVGLCVDGRWVALWRPSSVPTVPMRKRGGK